MATDIIIYRHGQDDPVYDCNWEEVASTLAILSGIIYV